MRRRYFLGGLAALSAGLWLASRRASTAAQVAPDLRSPLTLFRWPGITPTLLPLLQPLSLRASTVHPEVRLEKRVIPGEVGQPDVTVYLYLPLNSQPYSPAVFYTHGGGFIVNSAATYHAQASGYAAELGMPVISTEYRLAPQTPFPGALDDLYTALKWTFVHADELGIDPTRIALAGESAGGGLSACLAQLAYDRQEVRPAFQALIYPMLDDRTAWQGDQEGRGELVWTLTSNRTGWSAYLGQLGQEPPAYAAAARRADLSGLPPAWIGCGTLDLFYPEGRNYAERLQAAGVPCEWVELPGAYHSFDALMPQAQSYQQFRRRFLEALRRGLRGTSDASDGTGAGTG